MSIYPVFFALIKRNNMTTETPHAFLKKGTFINTTLLREALCPMLHKKSIGPYFKHLLKTCLFHIEEKPQKKVYDPPLREYTFPISNISIFIVSLLLLALLFQHDGIF